MKTDFIDSSCSIADDPIISVVSALSGFGWLLANPVFDSAQLADNVLQVTVNVPGDRITLVHDRDTGIIQPGCVRWNRGLPHTAENVELDRIHSLAILSSLRRYVINCRFPQTAAVFGKWDDSRRIYVVNIGPSPGLAGCDIRDWWYEVSPDFTITWSDFARK